MGGLVGGGWGWVGKHAPTHLHSYAPTHQRTHTPTAPWLDAPRRSKSPEHGTGFAKKTSRKKDRKRARHAFAALRRRKRDGRALSGWVGGPSINNLARTIMNSKMAQIHGAVVSRNKPKMLFSRPARDFLPTRANIVCFRRSSISVFLGDRTVCGWVGGHFSLCVAWVSSPPTYLHTINILGSSEFDVKFSTFCC